MHIVCFSDITWNFLWQRQQQMVSRFPRDWKVLYVEPSFWLSLAWSLFNRMPFRRNYMAQQNVEVVSVMTIPFGDRFGLGRRGNDRIIVGRMKKLLRERGIDRPVLLFYKPRYSCVIGRLGESAVCYDITDDVREFDSSRRWLEEYIASLEQGSDLVFTSSERIFRRLQDGGKKNAFLIGNGVEASHFEKASQEATPVAEEVRDLPSPVIGYVGAIGEWFDFELLQKILQRLPGASVVLVGWAPPRQKGLLRKMRSENLHFLGAKKYQELPGYIKAFDVCIIPFLLNSLTQSVNPNKFYEYLASGKPVVTTALPEIEKFGGACMIAGSHEEFIEHLRSASEEKHDPGPGLEVARGNDWSGKAALMVEKIGRFCAK